MAIYSESSQLLYKLLTLETPPALFIQILLFVDFKSLDRILPVVQLFNNLKQLTSK